MIQRFVPLACLLASAACASGKTGVTRGDAAAPSSSDLPTGGTEEMIATLVPVNSRLSGTVQLRPGNTPGESRASISIQHANVGAEHPWQIREGRCGDDGAEVGPAVAYRWLTARSDGTADLNVTIPVGIDISKPRSVVVYLAQSSRDRIIACGNLSVVK